MQPWRRAEPTQANTIELIIHQRNGNFDAVCWGAIASEERSFMLVINRRGKL